jgi:hypothetical protein
MIRGLLRHFGFYKIDHGFATGRHWIEIDGKTIADTDGDDIRLRDIDVLRIGARIFGTWTAPEDDLDEYHARQHYMGILLAEYARWAEHKSFCERPIGDDRMCTCGLAELEFAFVGNFPSLQTLRKLITVPSRE